MRPSPCLPCCGHWTVSHRRSTPLPRRLLYNVLLTTGPKGNEFVTIDDDVDLGLLR